MKRVRRAKYLQELYGFVVLFFSAELGHLDQNGSGVTGILGSQARRQLITLIGLRGDNRDVKTGHICQ